MRSGPSPRSFLYVPGDRPELFAKAGHSGADAVIIDLEDAVAPQRRDQALENIFVHADELAGYPCEVHARLARLDPSGYDAEAATRLLTIGIDRLRLAKCESADDLAALVAATGSDTVEQPRFVPIIESATALAHAGDIARVPGTDRLALGASDLLADLGVPAGADEDVLDHARFAVVVASRVAGIGAPIDSVYTNLDDTAGLRRSAERGRRFGMDGKSIIHPAQTAVIHEVWTPTAAEVAAAERIVAQFESAMDAEVASTRVGSAFVDPAVVARARRLLQRSLQGDT